MTIRTGMLTTVATGLVALAGASAATTAARTEQSASKSSAGERMARAQQRYLLSQGRAVEKLANQQKRFARERLVLARMVLPGTARAKRTKRTIETSPASFEIKSENCSQLAPGTTINGTGTLTSITWTTRRRGHRTVTNTSVAPGTATDQAGNEYTFLYSNQFRVTNTRARPKVYSGTMVDVFELQGTGPATLSIGLLAKYKTDLGELQRIRPIDAFGDPYDFEANEARCDPL
jgi:hypothetical protein